MQRHATHTSRQMTYRSSRIVTSHGHFFQRDNFHAEQNLIHRYVYYIRWKQIYIRENPDVPTYEPVSVMGHKWLCLLVRCDQRNTRNRENLQRLDIGYGVFRRYLLDDLTSKFLEPTSGIEKKKSFGNCRNLEGNHVPPRWRGERPRTIFLLPKWRL